MEGLPRGLFRLFEGRVGVAGELSEFVKRLFGILMRTPLGLRRDLPGFLGILHARPECRATASVMGGLPVELSRLFEGRSWSFKKLLVFLVRTLPGLQRDLPGLQGQARLATTPGVRAT